MVTVLLIDSTSELSVVDKEEEKVMYQYDFKVLRSTLYSISFGMTHTKPKHSLFALVRAIIVKISRDTASILGVKMTQMSKMMITFKREKHIN